jgi:aminopeptidase N
MRTEELRPIRLTDYRPPDWLIESVDLDVSLDPTATRVHAKLKIKPNSASAPAPLVLDGDELKLVSLALDGKPLPAEQAPLSVATAAVKVGQKPAANFGAFPLPIHWTTVGFAYSNEERASALA